MDSVSLKGFPIRLHNDLPAEGIQAEDFYYIKSNLNEESLLDLGDQVKLIVSAPSVDTAVGLVIAKKFQDKLTKSKLKGFTALMITKDLPFASKRVFDNEKITALEPVSDFRYGDYGEDYGVLMLEGALRGLLANSVLVLDNDNKIIYSELVSEIFAEPDYDSAIEEIQDLIK